MSPNATKAKLSTPQDSAAEEAIIEAWYREEVTARRFDRYASADWHVTAEGLNEVVEVKDRHYPTRFLSQQGYKVGVTKLEGVIALAGQYQAVPVLLVRTDDSLIRMDPKRLLTEAPRKMFQRERGAHRRKDLPELCAVARGDLWEEVRPRTAPAPRPCPACHSSHPPLTTCALGWDPY